jgi:hypothetical protein
MQPHRGAGKAALLGHGKKRFELIQFHERYPVPTERVGPLKILGGIAGREFADLLSR